MSKPNHRPKTLPDSVRVETTVPLELGAAIDSLAAASGVSRYSFVRQVIVAGLQPFATTNPELAAVLQATTYTRSAV